MPDDSNAQSAVQRFSALDVDLAPPVPGIYAWYGQLSLAQNDWTPRIAEGVDRAAGYLTRAIGEFARAHQPNPVQLRGDGTYRLPWTGTLRRASIADTANEARDTAIDARLGPLISEPAVRELLIMLLGSATPVFASPLYIGVATNLRSRLAEHLRSYDEARALIKSSPSVGERLQFEGSTFGARLAGTGLQLEHITCWVIPADLETGTDGGGQGHTSARDVAEAAEWILQRTFLPVLGRR